MSSEIKADKWSPASGTSATIGDSGDTFTVPSGVTLDTSSSTLTLPSSAITGQTAITSLADTDKFLVSDASDSGNLKYVEKQYLPSGGLVLVGTGSTSSNVSAVNITGCFSSTYRQYLTIFEVTPDTNGANPRIQFLDSNDNVISSSAYGYAWLGLDFGGGEERFTQDNNEAHLQIGQGTYNQSNTDFPALSGYLWIVNPFSSSNNVNWHGQIMNRGNNGEDRIYVGSGRYNAQTQCAGLKFFFSSGNVNNATVKVYGLVDN